jgi:hypothetical protein
MSEFVHCVHVIQKSPPPPTCLTDTVTPPRPGGRISKAWIVTTCPTLHFSSGHAGNTHSPLTHPQILSRCLVNVCRYIRVSLHTSCFSYQLLILSFFLSHFYPGGHSVCLNPDLKFSHKWTILFFYVFYLRRNC